MRSKLAIKSSIIGVLTKITAVVLSFFTSRLFVKYIGIEMQGINSVFSNLIGFLQLAELGIGTAITYELYRPIAENNILEIKILMNFYKLVYRWIFGIIMTLGLAMIPFLKFFIVDTTYDYNYIVLVFFLQVCSAGVTYLMSYKRNLMYADQKQYIYTYIDSIINCIFVVIRIVIIIYLQSYVLYLFASIMQYLLANIIVNYKCNTIYPFLKEKVIEKYDKMDELIANLKNIVVGKIGTWIYSSTDNIIMSRFVGVVTVGMMASYYVLKGAVVTIVTSIVAPIQPMIANYIRDNKTVDESYNLFMTYTFIRYCIANVSTVGIILMANPIVSIWIGEDYVLPYTISVLMAIDLYIAVTHGPTGEFIASLGLFYDDKRMALVGMLINLVSSILLVFKFGAEGVLIGTVIAQIYYWIARGRIVFRNYFKKGQIKYILKVIKYTFVTGLEVVLLMLIYNKIGFDNSNIIDIFTECIACIIVSVLFCIGTNIGTDEFRTTVKMIKTISIKIREKNNI